MVPIQFLQELGLDDKEIRVLMSVLKVGVQPASVIAKHCKLDRTTTYRILKQLTQKKLLSQSKKGGITVFYNEKTSSIQEYLVKEKERLALLETEFDSVAPQLESLKMGVQAMPKIQIYDGTNGITQLYSDVIKKAKEQNLLVIRILGSNTFSQQLEGKEMGPIMKKFEHTLTDNRIKADILIAQGNLTREWITHMNSLAGMANLPAAGGATNVILVGDSVFMVSFREFPVGIRLDHRDIAQTMHFLFDVVGR